MKKKYTSFSNRLTQKVMLTVLVTLVILSCIILTLTLNAVKAEEKGRYYAIMSLVNEKLGRILATEEICVRNVFDNVWTSLDSPETVLEALEKEIKLNDYPATTRSMKDGLKPICIGITIMPGISGRPITTI